MTIQAGPRRACRTGVAARGGAACRDRSERTRARRFARLCDPAAASSRPACSFPVGSSGCGTPRSRRGPAVPRPASAPRTSHRASGYTGRRSQSLQEAMKRTLASLAVIAAAAIAPHASAQTRACARLRAEGRRGTRSHRNAVLRRRHQASHRRHRRLAPGDRHGQGPLPRHARRRQGVRQFLQARPAGTFPLDRVVPCWTQALQKLKVGGKATLTCPPSTAYGPRGIPNVIPPDSTLTFDVELLSIGG